MEAAQKRTVSSWMLRQRSSWAALQEELPTGTAGTAMIALALYLLYALSQNSLPACRNSVGQDAALNTLKAAITGPGTSAVIIHTDSTAWCHHTGRALHRMSSAWDQYAMCHCTGALAAARVEQDGILGMCLGMSGVDRDADASSLKARLQEWLPAEARMPLASELRIRHQSVQHECSGKRCLLCSKKCELMWRMLLPQTTISGCSGGAGSLQ